MRLAPLLVLYVAVCAVTQPDAAVRDEPALLAAAERLVEHGQWAGTGTDPDQRAYLWHGPGMVVFLAPLVALGLPLDALRWTSPLLLFAAVVLFHGGLRTRVSARVATLATLAFGLYLPFVVVLGTIQKEPLAILLVVATMRLFVAERRAAAGLALAGLIMVRPEYGWVAIALLAAALLARRHVLVPAVALVACVPWLAYTEQQTGQRLYWTSASGLSLFWMSPTGVPGETGQWHSPVRVHRDDRFAEYRPLFRHLDEVHPLESDRVLRDLAWQNIRAEPATYARNLAANALRLLVFAPTRPAQPWPITLVYALSNGALLAAAGWAALRLWRRRRAGLPPETIPFALLFVLGVGVHLPPSASPRMLMPLVPLVLWLAARAADPRGPEWDTGDRGRDEPRISRARAADRAGRHRRVPVGARR